MDNAYHEKRFRERAAECRVLAAIVEDPTARDGYLELARAYMLLAMEAEATTRMMRKAIARSPAKSSNLPRHRSVTRAICRALIIQH
jgi:hypothetical protein